MSQKRNPNSPHVAIIKIAYELMEIRPDGEYSAHPIEDSVKYFKVVGATEEECRQKAQKILELIAAKNQT